MNCGSSNIGVALRVGSVHASGILLVVEEVVVADLVVVVVDVDVGGSVAVVTSGAVVISAQSKSSQGITETFGARTGERIYFEHDGKQYNAFKLGGGGFDLYRGSMKIDTTGGKNAAILKSFIEYGQERVKPPATKSSTYFLLAASVSF